jgi:antitoxin (DNA-binding transcriptional repressor) of toxin-antitoxin stability system
MKAVTIHDAKTNLSKYIAAAKKGEKIYIGGFGNAEVVLSKLPIIEHQNGAIRSFSLAKGKVNEKSNSFSAQTDQEIASLLYGE